ncbi:NUDIX domain-containing protein [Nonomuraea sp. NPDC050556]|uniref:NUDIX hydrolase n=1 Tax=Nonomuraea sp. NPDC050556 TaxID=3364369 RepID=UPI0037B4EA05
MRPSVRGVLLDPLLVVFRRTVPGREIYWTLPGGHVEPGDASLEDTLRRELMEELGATITDVTPLTSLTCSWRGESKTQHMYGCRLVSMDLSLRSGPEFSDPTRGLYEVERLPLDPASITSLNMIPPEVGAYLAGCITELDRLIRPRAAG